MLTKDKIESLLDGIIEKEELPANPIPKKATLLSLERITRDGDFSVSQIESILKEMVTLHWVISANKKAYNNAILITRMNEREKLTKLEIAKRLGVSYNLVNKVISH